MSGYEFRLEGGMELPNNTLLRDRAILLPWRARGCDPHQHQNDDFHNWGGLELCDMFFFFFLQFVLPPNKIMAAERFTIVPEFFLEGF